MAWTEDDIPKLRKRRADLLGMIAHHEAGYPATQREHGEIVNDPDADLAGLKAKLAEVESLLGDLGVSIDD